jgi:hypothetical protein
MALESHLAELERKHRSLEVELHDAKLHPSLDDLKVAELKRQKLRLRDEIHKLKEKVTTTRH